MDSKLGVLVLHCTSSFFPNSERDLRFLNIAVAEFKKKKKNCFFNLTCNYSHNILKLFVVFTNSPFTASETMRDYHL